MFFKCDGCDTTFKHRQSFRRHIKHYPGPHTFPCNKCGKVFKRNKFLNNHFCTPNFVSDENSDNEIPTAEPKDVTEILISDEEPLKREYEIFHELQCKVCEWIFTTENQLEQHLNTYNKAHFVYPCCGKTLKRSFNILTHKCSLKDDRTEEKLPFICEFCNMSFFRMSSLKSHLRKYPGEHGVRCLKCGNNFENDNSLRKHLCILSTGEYFKCSCLKKFFNYEGFKRHVGISRPFQCCSCPQTSRTLNNLINHIRTHTKVKPFICEVCKKTFSAKESLKVHSLTHESVKPFQCAFCMYACFCKWNMKVHERTHDAKRDRRFLCAKCGVGFHMKHHLKRHCATHFDDKSHVCSVCGKVFAQSSYLDKHLSKHGGTR